MEEEGGSALGHREIADLVNDQQRRVGEGLEAPVEVAGGPGLLEGVDEFGQGAVVDPAAALGGGDGEGDRQVRLADAGGPEEDDVLPALDEAEFVQGVDLFALDRGLEAEVELGQRLERGQSDGTHGGGKAAAVAQRDLGGEKLLHGLGGGGSASIHARQDVVERLQGAGQLEIGELGRDALAAGGPLHDTPPAIFAYSASGRRSTSTIFGGVASRVVESSGSGCAASGR